MNVGIDIGYSAVKVVSGPDRIVTFPSVVGTPGRARFSINGAGGGENTLKPVDSLQSTAPNPDARGLHCTCAGHR